jgi:hypothetical protein
MAMITDRDLLLIEPGIFKNAMDLATLLIDAADGTVSQTSLSSASSDFESMSVDAGHVAVIEAETTEVIARVSSTELTVSLPRVTSEDPLIAPTAGSGLTVKVPTFGRQINFSQAWVLGALGLDAGDLDLTPDESAILNPCDIERLIALETVARVFAAAAALDPADQSLADSATHYAGEVAAARHRTRAILDLDGDGCADASRRVCTVALTRT